MYKQIKSSIKMKTALQKFWIAILAVVSFVACESKETMTPEEAAGWVAAYSPERIDIDATIRIEATKTLFEHIDTLRSLDNVFRFTPSVKGQRIMSMVVRLLNLYLSKEG